MPESPTPHGLFALGCGDHNAGDSSIGVGPRVSPWETRHVAARETNLYGFEPLRSGRARHPAFPCRGWLTQTTHGRLRHVSQPHRVFSSLAELGFCHQQPQEFCQVRKERPDKHQGRGRVRPLAREKAHAPRRKWETAERATGHARRTRTDRVTAARTPCASGTEASLLTEQEADDRPHPEGAVYLSVPLTAERRLEGKNETVRSQPGSGASAPSAGDEKCLEPHAACRPAVTLARV